MSDEPQTSGGLQRKTNWWGAFVIGLAGTLLVTGAAPTAIPAMGAACVPVFFVVTLAGVALCLCLAELAAMMPHRTGGVPSYAYETYKDLGPNVAGHVGGLSSWAYCIGWFPVAPINMILAAKYIAALFHLPAGITFTPIGAPITSTELIISIVGLLVLFIPCYLGIHLGARFATFLGVISIIPITLLVFLPFLKPETLHWENLKGFAPLDPAKADFTFYISWAFVISWSALAMEASACYIGECRNPARDAKIAMTASGLYGLFIYLFLPLMLLVVLGTNIGTDPLVAFLAYTEAIFGKGSWVNWFISLPLILALLLSVLNALMGCGRSIYQAAHDGLLPTAFEHTNRFGAPGFATAFNLVCSIIVIFFASPAQIYIFSNMGYLLSLSLAMIGYFLYRFNHSHLERPVRMHGSLQYVALILGVVGLFVWAYGGYYASDIVVAEDQHWLFFLGLIAIALYFPLHAYRRWQDRRSGLVTEGASI